MCLSVCIDFSIQLDDVLLIWTRNQYRKCWSILGTPGQLLTIKLHLLWNKTSVYYIVMDNSWHPHLLLSVWKWRCRYVFRRLEYIAARDRTRIHRMRGERPTNCAITSVNIHGIGIYSVINTIEYYITKQSANITIQHEWYNVINQNLYDIKMFDSCDIKNNLLSIIWENTIQFHMKWIVLFCFIL